MGFGQKSAIHNEPQFESERIVTTRGNVANYFWQTIIAMLFVWLVMIGFDLVQASQHMWVVGVATIATSTVYVFAMPNTTPAHPLRILVGYLLGLVIGIAMQYAFAVMTSQSSGEVGNSYHHLFEVGGFLAFGLTLIIMMAIRSEHPPAAALALLLVLEYKDFPSISIIVLAAILLALLRFLFGRTLKDLIW